MNYAKNLELKNIINWALKEDIGSRDITSQQIVPKDKIAQAVLLACENGIICGLGLARLIFKTQDKSINFIPKVKDGQQVKRGRIIAAIRGRARGILTAERVALNFLSLTCGIATQTKKFVERIKPYKTQITDSRKTFPGLRNIEKYAVRIGGGYNHRFRLDEMVLIKDNHIKAVRPQGKRPGSLAQMINKTRRKIPKKTKIEIEVGNLREFKEAIMARPDIIMLDNMKISDIRKAMSIIRRTPKAVRRPKIEASGGINLENIRRIAATGVDMISVGALTDSVSALDINLDIIN